MKGGYDDRFPEVFERRVVELAEFDPDSLRSREENVDFIINEEE